MERNVINRSIDTGRGIFAIAIHQNAMPVSIKLRQRQSGQIQGITVEQRVRQKTHQRNAEDGDARSEKGKWHNVASIRNAEWCINLSQSLSITSHTSSHSSTLPAFECAYRLIGILRFHIQHLWHLCTAKRAAIIFSVVCECD